MTRKEFVAGVVAVILFWGFVIGMLVTNGLLFGALVYLGLTALLFFMGMALVNE